MAEAVAAAEEVVAALEAEAPSRTVQKPRYGATMRAKVAGMLFERTALSKKPDALIRQELDALSDEDRLTPDLVFRDPYLLDFLALRDTYTERDLEDAILAELQAFILELGSDFAFVARQKRISIDDEDFYIDLLFFHRGLRRLIVVELKLGRFQAADKGQVELYLRWLDKHERREGEESPLGLILCAGKRQQQIELLERRNRNSVRPLSAPPRPEGIVWRYLAR